MTRLSRILSWQRVPARWIVHADPRAEARFWTLFALAFTALGVPVALLIRAHPAPLAQAAGFAWDAAYVLGYKILGLLLLPLALLRMRGWTAQHLLLGWRFRFRHWITLPWVLGLGLALNGGHLDAIRDNLAERPLFPVVSVALALILPLLAAALPEEIVFRAVLQTRLEAVLGRLPAILAASLLFTAWHLPTRLLLASGVEGRAGDVLSVLLGTGLPVFLAGLVFGLAWDRWRSLPHLVLFHWAVDVLPAMSSFLGIAF
jgi:membrane protease YdiL (CAAX protease family)